MSMTDGARQKRRVFGRGYAWSADEVETARVAYLLGGLPEMVRALPDRSRDALASKLREKVLVEKLRDWQRSPIIVAPPIVAPLPRFDSHAMLERIAMTPRKKLTGRRRASVKA